MINKTLTGVNALIKRNGKAIGYIRSLRINEAISRGAVQGIGELARVEVPPTSITCTLSIDAYNTTMKESAIPGAINRKAPDYKSFFNTLLLQDGIRLDLFKKNKSTQDPETGIISAKPEIFASITELFIDQDSMNLSEGQVSDRNQNFQYLNPILFKNLI